MRTVLLVILGWIGGHLLGSGAVKLWTVFFGIDISEISPFVVLLPAYLSALGLAVTLPFNDNKKRTGEIICF